MAHYDDLKRLKVNLHDNGVLEVVCHFVGRRNSYDQQCHYEFSRIWPIISHDRDVKVVVLRGHAGVLGGGSTPEMMASVASDWSVSMDTYQETRDMVMGVIDCSKPVVTAIEGAAVGGVLAAALVSDVSIAGNSAKIFDPHTLIGLTAGDGGAIIWPLLCGMARTKFHLLTGEPLDGRRAAEIGLVSEAVDDEKVIERSMEIATRLAKLPTLAVRWTKHSLNGWLRMATPMFDHSLALEWVTMMGPDLQEFMKPKIPKV